MVPIPSSVPVLITGASSGLGEHFARRYAQRGHAVTVVARRTDRLERLASELRKQHGAEVTVVTADLETETARRGLRARLSDSGPWVLVNNAGYGSRGRFWELERKREHGQVMLNVVALHDLTEAVLPGCVAAGAGGVLNVASTAAFQPLPHMSTYAATKAFVLHFTEGIAEELRGTGARAMALCPGPTRTEFAAVAGNEQEFEMALPMSAEKVVRSAIRAFDKGHVICTPGLHNAVLSYGPRLVPRAAVRRLVKPIFSPR